MATPFPSKKKKTTQGIVDIDGVGTAAQNDGNSGGDSTSDDEDSANASEHIQGLIFGNKMAILGGDFLLASACTGLSRLQSAPVVSMMSAAIGDAVEGKHLYAPELQAT